MSIVKSPELLKTEALAQTGVRLTSTLALVKRAADVLANGQPADGRGSPALTGAEIRAVVGEPNSLAIEAAAEAIEPTA